jgi:2-methylcitrate dehydratase PrpD
MQITSNADAASIFVASARERPLPDNVLLAARMCLVDWFGVAIAARDEGAAQVVLKVAAEMTHNGGARILFGRNADAATAAMVNGTMAHCLDFDDTHVGSLAHLSGPIWAATLAVGTAINATPGDMLKAFVTGFEIGARIGRDGFGEALNTRSIHSTGICGCIGAAAAASALYSLDAERTKNALGAAATQAAGLTGSFGTMSKPFHVGKAAFNGVLSAQLARSGFVAAGNLIEERDGIAAALIQDHAATIAPMTFAKSDWEILRNTFKPYASCLLTHPVIDSGRKLHAQIGNRGVESVVVNVHPMAVQLAGKPEPRTPLEGKFSTAYCAALALSGHSVAAADFSAERLADPKLRNLTARTELNVVPSMPKTAASMAVTLNDGATLKADTPLALGNPDNPMSWNDIQRKFLGLAEPVIGQSSRTTFDSLKRFTDTGDLDAAFATLQRDRSAAAE